MPLLIGGLILAALLIGGGWVYLSGVADDIESDVADALDEPSPTPRPTAERTPEAIGQPGVVTFGHGLDESLRIEEEDSTFSIGEPAAFSASFSEPAGATSLDVIISSVDSGGAESVVYTETITIGDPSFDTFGLEDFDLSALVGNERGRYVLRFYRETTLLSEGNFRIRR